MHYQISRYFDSRRFLTPSCLGSNLESRTKSTSSRGRHRRGDNYRHEVKMRLEIATTRGDACPPPPPTVRPPTRQEEPIRVLGSSHAGSRRQLRKKLYQTTSILKFPLTTRNTTPLPAKKSGACHATAVGVSYWAPLVTAFMSWQIQQTPQQPKGYGCNDLGSGDSPPFLFLATYGYKEIGHCNAGEFRYRGMFKAPRVPRGPCEYRDTLCMT